MKKLIIFLSVLSIIIIGGIVGYKQMYLVSPRVFFNSNNEMIYANENLSGKKYDDFSKFGAKVENEIVKINQLKKYVDGIYAFSHKKEGVVILHAGLKFPIISLKINEYFLKSGDIYTLKDEYLKHYEKNLKLLGVTDLKKLYMKPYKGSFVLSRNIETINSVLTSELVIDDSITKALNKNKNGNLGTIILNMEKNKKVFIEKAIFSANYTNNTFSYKGSDKWKDEYKDIIKIPEVTVLSDYVSEKSLYISGVNFENVNVFMEAFKEKLEVKEVLNLVEKLIYSSFKVSLNEILSSVGDEIVYDMEKESGIITLKKIETAKKIVGTIEFLNKLGLRYYAEIEGNLLYIGKEKLGKSNPKKSMKKNQFLYLNQSQSEKMDVEIESYYKNNVIDSEGTIVLSEDFINMIKKEINN